MPEMPEANPDTLPESAAMFIQTEPELSDSVRTLVMRAKKELTSLQFQIFALLTGLDGRLPLTIRETGLKLNMHPSRVQRQWDFVRVRLQSFYERPS